MAFRKIDSVVLPNRTSLAGTGLRLASFHCIGPSEFWPQLPRRALAGIWVLPSSAEVLITHRRLESRSQTRQAVPAGGLLIRGMEARSEWSVAIPPVRKGTAGEPTRKFLLLLDLEGEQALSAPETMFETYRPRDFSRSTR